MITKLRRRHRTWIAVLFVVASGCLVWAIVARKATPHVVAPPGAAAVVP